MSYLLLHKGHAGTLLADDPIVPAADISPLRDSMALLAQAEHRFAAAADAATELNEAAQHGGYEEGMRRGEAEGAAKVSAKLFDLEVKSAELRASQRTEAAKLAIEIVRRIAAGIGRPEMVAALAEKAAADLAPDTSATVKVHPSAAAQVTERLGQFDRLAVVADSLLGEDECVVETSHGQIRAGLETQLTAIERAWSGGGDA